MQIRITTSDGIPIYQQIVNQVKYLASSGRLEAGDQLPPVRKLAEQLIVNPNTVSRAYRELEAAGVIETRRGAGAFVVESGSPLARREQNKILNERIDMLLAEARQMNVSVDTLIKMIGQRNRLFKDDESNE